MYKLLLPALLFIGCRNECQNLCVEMSDYASEDCGQAWSDDQVESCMAKYKDADDATNAACGDVTPRLREEWTCEDLEPYFDDTTSSEGGEDTSGGSAQGGSDTDG